MKAISKQATKTLKKLLAGLLEIGDNRKIGDGKTFMAVSVEKIGERMFSVSHYFTQNGDLVPDPDMVFYHGEDDCYYPVSFQDQFRYDEAMTFENGKPKAFAPKLQRSLATFTTTWMQNINSQQNL